VAVIARPLGIQTNNVAEYSAILFALQAARELGVEEVDIVLDSKLVVEQLSGRWKVRNPVLARIHHDVVALLAGFRRWTARHEGRASNRAADALANLALDDPDEAARQERAWRARLAAGSAPREEEAPDGDACRICAGADGDAGLRRVEVWRDSLWRLTVSLAAPVPGFAYLEPHRHVPSLAELDGDEASTLGPVLAGTVAVLRDATGAERVYVYVFGERIPHLHFNLAPHRPGDPLRGGRELADPDAPLLPAAELLPVARRIERAFERG
jgi:diadenosine tetraphosphate (Ap4A) HIT family hydrolase